MYFSALQLTHFRNYEGLVLRFGPGIVCFNGNNGEGKTNLLEAVHYLAMTRGFSGKTEKYALKEGETFFIAEGLWMEAEDRKTRIQVSYLPQKGKKVLVDNKPLAKMSAHIGRIPLITVLPNDTQLIYGTPSVRRKFLDAFISQYDPEYLNHLIVYEKALDQRNALLAMFANRGQFDPLQVELWDRKLIPAGIYIHQARKQFLETYAPVFERYFLMIVSDKEKPSMEYQSQIKTNTEKEWSVLLQGSLERDRYAQRTGIGIHKDDLLFLIDGNEVKNFGSQGQQKTFVISLKLAQFEMLEDIMQKPPVLLLDDIFDKLDDRRMGAIADILDKKAEGQVFVTDTSPERTHKAFSRVNRKQVEYWRVEAGKVEKVSG